MVFGRRSFARSATICSRAASAFSVAVAAQTQQQPASPCRRKLHGPGAASSGIPLAQAAPGSAPNNPDHTKPAENGSINSITSGNSSTPGRENSSLRLGPGDLIEVGVYNVPELSTKARIGNSTGDILSSSGRLCPRRRSHRRRGANLDRKATGGWRVCPQCSCDHLS